MKQFLTILFVLLSYASFAQFPNTHTQSNSHTKEVFLGAINPQKGLINTRYPDTATANLDYIAGEPGGQIIVGNTIYVRNTTATGWIISANSSVTPSNVTIYNDSTLIICNNNGCDSFKTNIVINNFNIVNDSTIIVCDGNNTCDTINTNPTVFAKYYVDSTKIIDGIIYYYINGNAYNGGNISNFVYNIVDSLADTKVTIENGTIISGIRVSYDSLLTFSITSGYYRLNDSTYYYDGGSVTLPAADATNPTIDAIILDTTGVTVLQGVPATNPASPQITGLQILLTNVTVNANATTPVGISNSSIIYDENTETTTSSTMTADFNDVAQPFHLIKDISATAGLSGSYQQFLFGSIQSSIDYTNITLHIRLNASLSKKSDLSIQFFNGTANVSQSIILGTNYGFNKNLTGTYQTVVIPISDFNFYSSNFNIVRLTFTGNSFSSFYMDYIVLQTGVSGGGSPTFTQIQSDWSQTVNTQPDYIKNKPVVYTKTQTDSIAALKLNTTDTTNKWIPKGTYFPIGVHKPIIAIDSFDIGLDSFNLKELRYSLAQRDTTNWTDTTLIDKGYLNARISAFVTGTYHLPYNGTSTDYLGGDTAYHPLPTIPAQFNPIAGTNITLSGSYPNITFNSSGGGSSLWTQNADSSIYYTHPVIVGRSANNGASFQINGPFSMDLGSDSTGDMYWRNSLGLVTRIPAPTGLTKPVLTYRGTPQWTQDSTGGVTVTPAGSTGSIQFKGSGNQFVGLSTIIIDSAHKRLGIGTANPSSLVTVVDSSMVDAVNLISIFGKFPSTQGGTNIGSLQTITTAGTSNSTPQVGAKFVLAPGHTGSSQTVGLSSENDVAGTNASWTVAAPNNSYRVAGNTAIIGISYATTSGTNVGFRAVGVGGNLNIGSLNSSTLAKANATNIATASFALDTASGGVHIAGYFGLSDGPSAPVWGTSAALVANNGTTTNDIVDFRDNNTSVFKIADGGATTLNGNLTLGTAGNKIKITTGTNASAGTGAFSAGSATISTTAVTASSLIFIQYTGTVTNSGQITVSSKTAGTSFTVTSTNASDANTFNWWIIN